MTFEEWKAKHDDKIVNVATVFFNYERGVDTKTCYKKTCYNELEFLLRKAFISGQNHCNCIHNTELEQKYSKQADDFENMKAGLESEITELKEENTELKAQIEKMKCCPTCDNNKEEHTPEEHYRCKTCKKFCNWELAN